MAKIILTEGQLERLKTYLNETIDPSEAYTDEGSIKTVIDGERPMGYLSLINNNPKTDDFLKRINDTNLKIIKFNQAGHSNRTGYLFYQEGAQEDAIKLSKIIRKNQGYLPIKSPEETYVIGILLGYDKDSVKSFVLSKFPDFNFY